MKEKGAGKAQVFGKARAIAPIRIESFLTNQKLIETGTASTEGQISARVITRETDESISRTKAIAGVGVFPNVLKNTLYRCLCWPCLLKRSWSRFQKRRHSQAMHWFA